MSVLFSASTWLLAPSPAKAAPVFAVRQTRVGFAGQPTQPLTDLDHFDWQHPMVRIPPSRVRLNGSLPAGLSKQDALDKLEEAYHHAQKSVLIDLKNGSPNRNGLSYGSNLLMDDGHWNLASNMVQSKHQTICSEILASASARNDAIKNATSAIELPKPVMLMLALSDDIANPTTVSCAICQNWLAAFGPNLRVGTLQPDPAKPGDYVLNIQRLAEMLPGYWDRVPSKTSRNIEQLAIEQPKHYPSQLNAETIQLLLLEAQQRYNALKAATPNEAKLKNRGDVTYAVGLLSNGAIIDNVQIVWTNRLFQDPGVGLIQKTLEKRLSTPTTEPITLKAIAYYGDSPLPTADALNWLAKSFLAGNEVSVITIHNDQIRVKRVGDQVTKAYTTGGVWK